MNNHPEKTIQKYLQMRTVLFPVSGRNFSRILPKKKTGKLSISNQTMPELTGVELAQSALKIKPSLPVIICTGHSDVVSEEEAIAMGIIKYVFKPLHGDELLDAVQDVLS